MIYYGFRLITYNKIIFETPLETQKSNRYSKNGLSFTNAIGFETLLTILLNLVPNPPAKTIKSIDNQSTLLITSQMNLISFLLKLGKFPKYKP